MLANATINITAARSTDAGDSTDVASSGGAIVFMFGTFIFGALARTLSRHIPVPYTVYMMLVGVIIGYMGTQNETVHAYNEASLMDPKTLLEVALPVLIFNSAINIDVSMLYKASIQIFLLAIPGLLLNNVLVAIFARYIFPYNWDLLMSILFGSIVTGTDPMGAMVMAKQTGSLSGQFAVIIGGESLINEGIAIIVFHIFFDALLYPKSALDVVTTFLYAECLGPVFGYAIGKITTMWLVNVFDDVLTEVTIVVSVVCLTFFMAEHYLYVSGVLAVVALGVCLNQDRECISPDVEKYLRRLWDLLAFFANCLIFLLVGDAILEHHMEGITKTDIGLLFAFYIFVNVSRLFTIFLMSPLLSRTGYGLSWKEGLVISWGALRGAVCLELGLYVFEYPGITNMYGHVLQSQVIFHCTGLVMLTLLLNATTINKLMTFLELNHVPRTTSLPLAQAIRDLRGVARDCVRAFKMDRFLGNSVWSMVEEMLELEDPYDVPDEEIENEKLIDIDGRIPICPTCLTEGESKPTDADRESMENIARLRLLKAQKASYLKQYELGLLGYFAMDKLLKLTDDASDMEGGYIELDAIKSTWKVSAIYGLIRWKLEKVDDRLKDKIQIRDIAAPANRILKLAYRICRTQMFQTIIWMFVFLNMIIQCIDFTIWSTRGDGFVSFCDQKIVFDDLNYIFVIVYLLEAVIRVMGFRVAYFRSHWHRLDLFLLVVGIVDVAVDLQYIGHHGIYGCEVRRENAAVDGAPDISDVILYGQTFRALRLLRGIKVVRGIIYTIMVFIYRQVNEGINFGYDVGKGYVMGQEEVNFGINDISEDPEISEALHQRINTGRMEITKELGMMQEEHPGIALSVITEEATRWILHIMREKNYELRKEGSLDELQSQEIDLVLDEKMKRLVKMPPRIEPSDLDTLRENLPWVEGDTTIMQYMKEHAELLSKDDGEKVISKGDMSAGLYIIMSGLIKVANNREEDYLSTSTVLGENSLLTGDTCNADITCETATTLDHLSSEAILHAMENLQTDPSIEYRLWKVFARRLTPGILKHHYAHKDKSLEAIKIHLERAELYINLYPSDRDRVEFVQFEVNPILISDVVLIHGSCRSTRDITFDAPCYIPLATDTLTLLDTPTDKHVLLIVPREGLIEFKSENQGGITKVFGVPKENTNLCLLHSAEIPDSELDLTSVDVCDSPALPDAIPVASSDLSTRTLGRQ